MIVKHEKQAIQVAKWFGIAVGLFLFCILIAMAVNLPTGVGILVAVAFAGAIGAMLIFYFRWCYYFGAAKGYSTITFLILLAPLPFVFVPDLRLIAGLVELVILPVLLIMLSDVSNPAKEAEEEKYTGPRCVCCNIRISPVIKVCPKCGWTQPAADVPTPV